MSHNQKYFVTAILIFMVIMMLQINVFAQKKCIFFSTQSPEEDRDTPLVTKLSEKYTVEVFSIDDLGGWVDTTKLKEYDFAFVSESIPSARGGGLKGAPIPLFMMELWGSKWDIMGWVPYNWNPDYYGTTEEDQNKITIVNDQHPLAAGFSFGTEIELISPLIPGSGPLTYSLPQIDFIQIATLSADPLKSIVFGIEKGTALFNNVNVNDGSLLTKNRVAAVGVMAGFYANITDDGWKLIDAGIQWITGTTSAIEENNNVNPFNYSLEQNYPNPFNPTTLIKFTLAKDEKVTLKVFNLLGVEVATLLDGKNISKGNHSVNFDAKDLVSGVYFYKLNTEKFTATKKMTLVK